jgi:hypothetical protein
VLAAPGVRNPVAAMDVAHAGVMMWPDPVVVTVKGPRPPVGMYHALRVPEQMSSVAGERTAARPVSGLPRATQWASEWTVLRASSGLVRMSCRVAGFFRRVRVTRAAASPDAALPSSRPFRP